ncbi:hypothetical protein E3T54_09635 [Cryobacterium sp. Sr8]|uniref:hypothetical protein n=1 Tax=Cryobacterium sp. Sr8 TaxID=1259203 RepID=UPI00106B5025|nr:hypothetical protein [Cryobacterium sp. Sr8]TFD76807.1 hypothetical protein E3T54_09635 [Cryobacterium sp. Sr8]
MSLGTTIPARIDIPTNCGHEYPRARQPGYQDSVWLDAGGSVIVLRKILGAQLVAYPGRVEHALRS